MPRRTVDAQSIVFNRIRVVIYNFFKKKGLLDRGTGLTRPSVVFAIDRFQLGHRNRVNYGQ